ncbi:Olfactory receptor 14J1, partial [Cariama cristata]
TVPKAMANSLWDTRVISYAECAAQLFLLDWCRVLFSHHHGYVALCKLLHYGTLLGSRACAHMAAAAWGTGFLTAVLHTANTTFGCFVFSLFSYVQILRAVLRIPCEQGRHKAFSMCLPHLAVVSLFVSTAMFAYLKPPSVSSPSLDLVMAILYSVVLRAVNPLIYSMRNQELKVALKKLI